MEHPFKMKRGKTILRILPRPVKLTKSASVFHLAKSCPRNNKKPICGEMPNPSGQKLHPSLIPTISLDFVIIFTMIPHN